MEKGNLLTAYFAALITIVSGLSVNEFVSLCGLIIGVSTLLINWVYKEKNHKLQRSYYAALLKQKGDGDEQTKK